MCTWGAIITGGGFARCATMPASVGNLQSISEGEHVQIESVSLPLLGLGGGAVSSLTVQYVCPWLCIWGMVAGKSCQPWLWLMAVRVTDTCLFSLPCPGTDAEG